MEMKGLTTKIVEEGAVIVGDWKVVVWNSDKNGNEILCDFASEIEARTFATLYLANFPPKPGSRLGDHVYVFGPGGEWYRYTMNGPESLLVNL
jgi:hypothetical protein